MKYNPKIVTAYFRSQGIPEPVYEYQFDALRKWRLDLAWPERKVCLEVQGGVFVRGRHSRGAAMIKEWEKLNTLAANGWLVLYCQPADLCMMETVTTILQTLKGRE